jgi:CheY-like chemotaxis protein
MPDELEIFAMTQTPTAERPLLGLTVLVVEDSLFACEAMRLLCLRSGARIRRADSLRAAHRHLSVYHPVVVIVDLGLPDGSGAELIADLAHTTPRVSVILGISGDANARRAALAAGADGFLEKPVTSLARFQAAVLEHLPKAGRPKRLRSVGSDSISPDPLALRDDLAHVADILGAPSHDDNSVAYVAQFLGGLAQLAGDDLLAGAASDLGAHFKSGQPIGNDVARITGLVRERLQNQDVV